MDADVSRISTIEELEAVLALPRAALFLWVPWSGPCLCRERLAKLALAASAELPQMLHLVDLAADDDAFLDHVRTWIAPLQPKGADWIRAGAGVLLFVQRGGVAAVFDHFKWGPPARIALRATEAFQEAGPP